MFRDFANRSMALWRGKAQTGSSKYFFGCHLLLYRRSLSYPHESELLNYCLYLRGRHSGIQIRDCTHWCSHSPVKDQSNANRRKCEGISPFSCLCNGGTVCSADFTWQHRLGGGSGPVGRVLFLPLLIHTGHKEKCLPITTHPCYKNVSSIFAVRQCFSSSWERL